MLSYKKQLVFLVTGFILFAAFFLYIYSEVKRKAIDDLNSRQMVYAQLAADGLEEDFRHHIEMLQYLAKSEDVIRLTARGKDLLKTFQQTSLEEIRGVTRVNAEGKILYSAPYIEKIIGADISRQDHIQLILKSKKPVLSDVFTAEQGFKAVALHVPVFRGKTFDGSVGFLLSFDALAKKYLDDISIEGSGYAWMISKKGIEIYCPLPGHAGNSVLDNCKDYPDILEMAQKMMNGEKGVTTYTFEQKTTSGRMETYKKQAVYMPIKIVDTFWSIVVATPEDTVLSGMARFRNQFMFVMLVLFLVFSAAAYSIARARSAAEMEKKKRQMEEGILKSAREIQDLYNNAPCGYHSLDADGRIVRINDTELTWLGYSREELLGKPYTDILSESSRALFADSFLRLKEKGNVIEMEYEMRRKDGSDLAALVTASTVMDAQGHFVMTRSMVLDMTERREQQKRLRESETLYRTALENTNDGIVISQNLKYVYANKKIMEMIGRPDETLVGQFVGKLVHPDDRQILKENYEARMKGLPLAYHNYDMRFIKPDQSIAYVNVSVVETIYQDKPAMLGFIRDITRQKEMENALRESEALYRTALEATSDGVSILQDGRYAYINQKFLDTLGFPAENPIGKPLGMLVHRDDQEMLMDNYQRRLRGEPTSGENELRVLRPNGAVMNISVTSVDIVYHGKPAVLSFIRDITEKKKTDNALRESEAIYRKALETTSDGVTITDIQTERYVYVNQRLMKTLGRPDENITGAKADIYVHPDDVGLGKKFFFIRKKEKKESSYFESRLVKPDGSIVIIGITATDTIYQGRPAIIAFITDISERKRAEEALRESERLYRTALETTSDGVTITQDGIYVYINQRMLNTIGRPDENLIGTAQGNFVHPEDWARVEEIYRVREKGTPLYTNYELRVIKPDGSIIYLHINTVKITYRGRPAILTFAIDITKRKEAETTLRESEELYRTSMEATSDGVSIVQDMKYVYVNQKLLDTLGLTRDELLNRTVGMKRLMHPEDYARVSHFMEKRLRGEPTPGKHDVRIHRPDGKVIYLQMTSVDIVYHGRPAIITFLQDITERKKIEETLRESEELYRTAMESTNDGISIIQDGKYVYANQKLLNTIGHEKGIIGLPMGIYMPEEDKNLVWRHYKSCINGTSESTSYEVRVIKSDGSVVTISISSVRITYKGQPAVISFILDVTDRKQAEEALRQSEEKYRTIIESIDDDYFETDLKGTVTFINKPYDWTGRKREELIGMNYREYTTPDMTAKINAAFNQIYRDGKPARITDYQVLHKNGGICHLEMSVSLICDADGKPIGFRGISRDVSDRIKMEEERKKLTEQLYQAQKMEAIGTLAGGIAHDFNNLLMGIQGYTSIMLLEVDATHPYFDQLKAIQTLVQSGASLTKQLLGFARAGRYEVVVTDLNDLISKSVNLFGRTKKEISIYEKYADNLRSVEVDRGQIEQVLLNLFVNAWQAMPGGGSLYLETENVVFDRASAELYDLKPGPYIKIAVTDTGLGMDEKTRRRIFDPFFTTKGMGRGTGLGLASAYGIIKGHGGMISVYSEKGQGTTFHIYLPASAKQINADVVQESELTGGRETILLVDDEEIITEVASRLLSELGYTILTAGSGEEALDIYTERKADIQLVILDMIMPGLSGEDTYDRLKAVNPDIRVILSSGYSVDGKAQAIMKKGVRVFLQKPYRLNELAQKIREALSD